MGRHAEDETQAPIVMTASTATPVETLAAASGSTRPLITDVARMRERRRRFRVLRLAAGLGVVLAWVGYRLAIADHVLPAMPTVDPIYLMTGIFFAAMIAATLGSYVFAGRSPHLVYRPEQLDVRFEDVKGLAPVTEDVKRSLDLFLSARTFRREMGGSPRRGLLFEGPPGTGKTHMAKAMAAEAGVPFLFVSATSFQSMFYGATSRKIRAFFTELRKAARAEGGAIAFIEEIDAIAMTRGGMPAVAHSGAAMTPGGSSRAVVGMSALDCGGLTGLPAMYAAASVNPAGGVVHRSMTSEGVGGVVNELLVQMQSFDTPTTGERMRSAVIDAVNTLLPASRQIPRPRTEAPEVLVIAATNRADGLDPALLRPGRFDRRLVFSVPDHAGRRELIDHFLGRKAHESEMDDDERRDALAGITQGYTPVMLEHLLDEALINAIRRDGDGLNWADLERARMVIEVGLGQPVGYTEHEKNLIATHEAGHATLAWLVAPQRRLEVLTIVKRADALGLLAHGDTADVYTRSRSELEALMCIAFGGQVAEELFFGDISTGPAGDLTYATNVAAQMVGQAGMSDTLISFGAVQGSAFGDPGLVGRVLGDGEGRRMVEGLLTAQKERAVGLLAGNRHLVEALRDALLERHELIGREITDVLEAAQAAHQASDQRPRVRVSPGTASEVPAAASWPTQRIAPPATVDLRTGGAWWAPTQRKEPTTTA